MHATPRRTLPTCTPSDNLSHPIPNLKIGNDMALDTSRGDLEHCCVPSGMRIPLCTGNHVIPATALNLSCKAGALCLATLRFRHNCRHLSQLGVLATPALARGAASSLTGVARGPKTASTVTTATARRSLVVRRGPGKVGPVITPERPPSAQLPPMTGL